MMRDRVTAFVAAVGASWAEIPVIIQALVILSVIDVVTGYMKAMINKDLSSSAARTGMVKKAMNFFLVATGWVAHHMLGIPMPLDQILAGYLVSIELISILENFEQSGIKLPKQVTQILRSRNSEKE